MFQKNILVPVADGIEEIEAITIIDILRRAGLSVRVCSIEEKEVTGANNIKIMADSVYQDEIIDDYDAIILPGGTKGAHLFAAYGPLIKALKIFIKNQKLVGAICASPAIVLAPNNMLDGKKATCYPAMKQELPIYLDQIVVEDQNIVTSQGPATALPFALKLVQILTSPEITQKVKNDILF
jgi:4-methyl-5(b-hydroxyethyl)-thiazole monophosphate biosynthesis